jgi:nucleoside-diphosphate-sugar epimerase
VKAMGQGFPATIIRPPAVYGPRDTDFLVMFKMVKKGVFPFWGRCVYSILYVEDLVRGIMAAAEDDRAAGETFFLGGEDVHTNEEIAAEMASALGSTTVRLRLPKTIMPAVAFLGEKMSKKGIINRDKMRELSFANWSCDAGKAEEVLGFKSRITLREGIKWTADWYRIHRWL